MIAMRNVWFCYVESARGADPVLFYDDPPTREGYRKNYMNPKLLQMHKLDETWEQKDDEITATFKNLMKAFPYVAPPEEA